RYGLVLTLYLVLLFFFFFSSRRRHTRCLSDWSSDVCSSDLLLGGSIVVESVFAWPGLGFLAFQALFARDFNLLLGIFFLSASLEIGRASCRERVYTSVAWVWLEIEESVGAGKVGFVV